MRALWIACCVPRSHKMRLIQYSFLDRHSERIGYGDWNTFIFEKRNFAELYLLSNRPQNKMNYINEKQLIVYGSLGLLTVKFMCWNSLKKKELCVTTSPGITMVKKVWVRTRQLCFHDKTEGMLEVVLDWEKPSDIQYNLLGLEAK